MPQLLESVKAERLATLQELLNRQQREFNAAFVGSILPVLIDGGGRKTGQMVGRSPYMQAVHVHAPRHLKGSIIDVQIVGSGANSLAGELVGPTPNGEGFRE